MMSSISTTSMCKQWIEMKSNIFHITSFNCFICRQGVIIQFFSSVQCLSWRARVFCLTHLQQICLNALGYSDGFVSNIRASRDLIYLRFALLQTWPCPCSSSPVLTSYLSSILTKLQPPAYTPHISPPSLLSEPAYPSSTLHFSTEGHSSATKPATHLSNAGARPQVTPLSSKPRCTQLLPAVHLHYYLTPFCQ